MATVEAAVAAVAVVLEEVVEGVDAIVELSWEDSWWRWDLVFCLAIGYWVNKKLDGVGECQNEIRSLAGPLLQPAIRKAVNGGKCIWISMDRTEPNRAGNLNSIDGKENEHGEGCFRRR